jgi:mono/diheme cytochrome c family protein
MSSRVRARFSFHLTCLALFTVLACKGGEAKKPTLSEAGTRGQQVYFANCIACHNADPKQDGVLGPAVFGSSKELLEARVLRAAYPDGYKPKRDTKTMVALPHLAPKLDDLTAFLNP